MLENKRIIVGVTGGIAAYKAAELVRQLRAQGALIRVVMTEAAKAFITPLTLQAVSGNPVHDALLSREAEMGMGHIELARWAEFILIAPASADSIARLAHGHANDLLTTLCLATRAPIAIAPAMNMQMWANPATQANVNILVERGFLLLGPASGSQACGDTGYGRMVEPEEMAEAVAQQFQHKLLAGKRVLITAGPTQEAIDPVRFISNYSSGKMGYAIAQAALAAGAEVTLISGPVSITCPPGIKLVKVITAAEMYHAVMQQVASSDIFIAAAAVADYRVAAIAEQKIKKQQERLILELHKNKDILMAVTELATRPFVVGFAAETENVITHAQQKLAAKNLDLIVANEVGQDKGFNAEHNQLIIIDKQQNQYLLPLASKRNLGRSLMELIANKLSR